jgi:hypothetical protein
MTLFNLRRVYPQELGTILEKRALNKPQDIVDYISRSGLQVYKRNQKINNPWLRLTIVFFSITWLIFFIFLPINFLFTGRWGYSGMKWFQNWGRNLGL